MSKAANMNTNNEPKNLRKYLEKGTYLGYIEEEESGERFAVIKSLKINKLFYLFSPDLSLLELMDAEQVYVRDPSQPNSFQEMFKDSIVPELKANDEILFTIDGGLIHRITEEKDKKKRVEFTSNHPNFLTGKLKYSPKSLENLEIVPYRDVIAYGQIMETFDKYLILDAGVFLFIELSGGNETKWNWETFKRETADEAYSIGDWLRIEFGEISFIEIIKH